MCNDTFPQEVRGKGVLELGCGVGLPGVAAAIAGAGQVILTDMVIRERACVPSLLLTLMLLNTILFIT